MWMLTNPFSCEDTKVYESKRKKEFGSANQTWILKRGLAHETSRSSHRGCSVKKGVLRNFTKCTGKHLCQSLFFNKVKGLRPATLFKKRLRHRCFPVNFAKFLRTSFLQNTPASEHLPKISIYSVDKSNISQRLKNTYNQDRVKVLCYLQSDKIWVVVLQN